MFDCHVHSFFSGDSDLPADDACEAAIQAGLDGLTFTDHLDIDYPAFDISFNIDFDAYSSFMDTLKQKYQNRLQVLKGIEVGFQPQVIDASKEVIQHYDFDFVIGSVHVIDRLDPYQGDYYIGKTKREAFERYLQEIYCSVRDFPCFDVIGHIGYIRRYGDFNDRSLRHADYSDLVDAILKEAIRNGIGIEVNSSGIRGILGTPIPDYDIIARYKELGGEILTLGSDAHFKEHIGSDFDEIIERLKYLGFKYVAHFEKRKPVFDKIK